MGKKEFTYEDLMKTVGQWTDPSKVPDWHYKVFSPNSDRIPTVYLEDEGDAFGCYDLFVLYAMKQPWSKGVRLRLEDKDGKMMDTGMVCG